LDELLRQYVVDGEVDYAGLSASGDLDRYIHALAGADPEPLAESDRLAFWINAYNALTLKLVADHYPTRSILRLTPFRLPGIPVVLPRLNTPFRVKVGTVAGAARTLDEIEHEILRKVFDEPRIHFAIVCAAKSCPPLRAEAYVGDRLDAQLDDQAIRFLHDPTRNAVSADVDPIRLSRIFKWFESDFGGSPAAVQRFIAPYFTGAVRERLAAAGYRVDYLGYDWRLNDRSR
jgi:hypothetical protein